MDQANISVHQLSPLHSFLAKLTMKIAVDFLNISSFLKLIPLTPVTKGYALGIQKLGGDGGSWLAI